MSKQSSRVLAVAGLVSLFALAWTAEGRAQCDWRTDYAPYRVRFVSVKVAPIFGAVPDALKVKLSAHRGELYTSDKPTAYAGEVQTFADNDPVELKYEQLVANKLKFSLKAFRYESCIEKVSAPDCERDFKGAPGAPVTQCLDVTVRRRGIEVDALNSAPYLALFPRSTLVKLLSAVPRPLLALNPGIDFDFDKEFGPALTIDTSTDLLDVRALAKTSRSNEPNARQTPSLSPAPTSDSAPGTVEISQPSAGADSMTAGPGSAETPALGRDTKLLLNLKAQKSLEKSFYNTETGLTFSRAKALHRLQNLELDTAFVANNRPQGDGTFLQNSITAGGRADLRLETGPFKLINLGARYRRSSNRLFSRSIAPELTSENAFESRVLADGNFKKGLLRMSAWFESGWPDARLTSYRRVAVIAGYSKEFTVARRSDFHEIALPDQSRCYTDRDENQTTNDPAIGVEILAGGGRAWGEVPEYARFYGGNAAANFLYDETSAQGLTTFPGGPLLRSAKRQQAGILTRSGAILGGTSYWHVNANVSIPISGWSQPLIPAEMIGGTAPETAAERQGSRGGLICRDLKYQLKNQVRRSGKQLLLARVAHDSLTAAEQAALRLNPQDPNLSAAQRRALDDATSAYMKAKKDLEPEVDQTIQEEIAPITDFIADHADVYSIKPLMMVEAARLNAPDAINNRIRYGFGGGFQVNVVTVRFEASYLLAANRLPGEERGNFVFRLIFRRFF